MNDYAKQTQSNPISKGPPMLLCASSGVFWAGRRFDFDSGSHLTIIQSQLGYVEKLPG